MASISSGGLGTLPIGSVGIDTPAWSRRILVQVKLAVPRFFALRGRAVACAANGCDRVQTRESRCVGGDGVRLGRPPRLLRGDGAARHRADARAACTGA